jgi:hypothetical protein
MSALLARPRAGTLRGKTRRAVDIGCGCGGKKNTTNGVVTNTSYGTVYQVMMPDGTVASEHESPVLARNQALAVGGRVRVTGKSTPATK